MLKKIKKTGLILSYWLLSIPLTFAQTRPLIVPTEAGIDIKIPHMKTVAQGASDIAPEQYLGGVFLPTVTRLILFGAGGIATLFIIIAGIEMLTAYGNDEKLGHAKKTIMYALAGLLICILAYAIVTIISSIQFGDAQKKP